MLFFVVVVVFFVFWSFLEGFLFLVMPKLRITRTKTQSTLVLNKSLVSTSCFFEAEKAGRACVITFSVMGLINTFR